MRTSEQINELATALAKAQAQMDGAKKGSINPHFKSRYADLTSVIEACRTALTDNGIAVIQSPRTIYTDDHVLVEVETTLLHTSGQWVADALAVPITKIDAQGIGSATTYARRYALCAFCLIAMEDDDANAAVSGPVQVPAGYSAFKTAMDQATTLAALGETFKNASKPIRDYATSQDRDWLDALKQAVR